MKNYLMIITLLALGLSASAQPVAGKFFAGGSLSISASTDKSKIDGTTTTDNTNFQFGLNPLAGYFLSDRIAVGLGLGLNTSVTKYPDNIPDKSTTATFYIEPFGRYYLISGKAGLFAQASISMGVGNTKVHYENASVETNHLSLDAGVSPGLYYYLTERLALEATIGWIGFETQVDKYSNDNKDISSGFEMSLHPSYFTLGLTFIL